jgi:cation-transporting P-type ATPase E
MASAVAHQRGGLSDAEARRRLVARPSSRRRDSSRSYASIVRANVFTVFNLILLVAGVATLLFGEWQDALFLGVLVSNSGIGIVQEVRAKRALDRLAALVAPTATVVRDGAERSVPAEDVVVGDLVRLAAGDQVVADGTLVSSEGLMLDEAILTGESEPVARLTARGSARDRSPPREAACTPSRLSARKAMPPGSPARRAPSGTRGRRSSWRSTGC